MFKSNHFLLNPQKIIQIHHELKRMGVERERERKEIQEEEDEEEEEEKKKEEKR